MLVPWNDIFTLNFQVEAVFFDNFFSTDITLEAKFIQTYAWGALSSVHRCQKSHCCVLRISCSMWVPMIGGYWWDGTFALFSSIAKCQNATAETYSKVSNLYHYFTQHICLSIHMSIRCVSKTLFLLAEAIIANILSTKVVIYYIDSWFYLHK